MTLSSYRPLSYSSTRTNWGSRRQLLIVYSSKSSALTENHLFFRRKYQFFRQNHTLSPKRGALMRYQLLGRAESMAAPSYHFESSATVPHTLRAVHGVAWYCMVLHGIAWYCMVVHGIEEVGGCVEERDPRAGT